jgi:hypothetical protein
MMMSTKKKTNNNNKKQKRGLKLLGGREISFRKVLWYML